MSHALEILQIGQKLARENGITIPHLISELYLGSAEAFLTAVEQAAGAEKRDLMKEARRACRVAFNHSRIYSGGMPEAMRLQGWLVWLKDQPAKARQWWERSLAKAEAFGMCYHAAMARLEMGRRLGEEEQLKRAEADLKSLGVQI